MTAMAEAFTAAGGPGVTTVFGASGLLRERIEKGEAAAVFASADVGHPETLARNGKSLPPVVFARNRLCGLAAPGVDVTTATLLERMLDPWGQARHFHPEGRSVGRLRLAAFREGRGASAGRLRHPERQGAEADRRPAVTRGAAGPLGLRIAHRRAQG
jgi:hypothetical protein